MKKRSYGAFILLISLVLLSFTSHAQNLSKGISFQGVIKTPSGQFPTMSGVSVLVKVLSPDDCILREESFSGVNISNGYVNLVVGRGTPTSNNPSPARDLKTVMNNSVNLFGLLCLSPDGSVNSLKTTYEPAPGDVRKLRISMQIDNDTVVADFNMRAVAYAVNAESLNGKSENSFINVNGVEGLTQANAESVFQRFTLLNNILNGSFAGNVNGNLTGNVTGDVSGTSENVRGVVTLSHGGTGATDASGARAALGLKGLAVLDLPTPVDTSKFLRGDGTWAAVVGGVSSINGKSGEVVLTTAELADFNSASDARALGVVNGLKAQANGLATLDADGKVPSSQLSLTIADIPNLDASKINSGTLTVNVNSTSVNAGTGQFTQLKVNDGSGKVLTMSRQAGGMDYGIQWPANVGAAGSVLQTDATGVLSWVAIPSALVSSVAGKTGPVTLVKNDIGGLGSAAGLDAGTSADNLVQLDSNAKIPASLLPNSVLTTSSGAGGDLTGTYPNPTVATGAITSSKIADGAVGSLSKVVSAPGSAGTNRLLATDTGAGTTIKDFYCTTVGHYLKWTGASGFGCAEISSADISDAASANNANTIVKRDPSGNFSAGTVTANLTGNVTGKLTGSVQSAVAVKTSNYSILDSDNILLGNATSNTVTFTLPSAVGMMGRQFTIKKTDSSSNAVTVATSSSQKIDGGSTVALSSQWQYLTVVSDGSNWMVVNATGNLSSGGNGLYSFTSHTFTNCGQTGRFGPNLSQCQSSYSTASWASNTNYLNITTQGIQLWTVPVTGNYRIRAVGAEGGDGTDSTETIAGKGADIAGTFSLNQGQVIKILVGQKGGDALGSGNRSGGGGGGTYIVNSNGTPLLIAGGGNGDSWDAWTTNAPGGRTSNNGNTGGLSETQGSSYGRGGGGAGLTTNGSRYSGSSDNEGISFSNGGMGGNWSNSNAGIGGFGGGGGAHYEGGGGGGYTGGHVVQTNAYGSNFPSYGAGSYNSGSNVAESANSNSGHGFVQINYLQ